MARWRCRPAFGQTALHSDRGAQYTSWAFGHRLRAAGLLGSIGRVGSALDNAMMESSFGTLQRELHRRAAPPSRVLAIRLATNAIVAIDGEARIGHVDLMLSPG